MSVLTKPIQAKPSLYAWYFELLKNKARDRGFALMLHGSMNNDLDLLLVPWHPAASKHMLSLFLKDAVEILGGELQKLHSRSPEDIDQYTEMPHGRRAYVINLNRGGYYGCHDEMKYLEDQKYYIDLSVIMPVEVTDRYVKQGYDNPDMN